jgi:hypothetical protein
LLYTLRFIFADNQPRHVYHTSIRTSAFFQLELKNCRRYKWDPSAIEIPISRRREML